MEGRKVLPSGCAKDLTDNNLGRPKFILSGASCQSYHQLLLYCCLHHEACLTGRPRFYNGIGLSPCVREEYEPDRIDYPTRRRWPYW